MVTHASAHFTTAELGELRSQPDLIEAPMEARLVYHLGARCPDCWSALRELPSPEDELEATDVPVVLALRRLTAPAAAVLELDACHRSSVLEAGERNLGFCFLVLEEIRKAAPSSPVAGLEYLRFSDDAISGNGVLLLHVPEAHDLHARYLTLVAGTLGRVSQSGQAAEALALARFHLDRGTGRPEIRAGCLEAEAALACAENRKDRGWSLLEDAAALLEDHDPADRRAETLLLLGNTMVSYSPSTRIQAHGIYQEALGILDGLAPGTNPRLGLSLTHQLVRLLLDLDLERRVNRIPGGAKAARKAAEKQLLGSEALYQRYATPELHGQRAAFLGFVYLETDKPSAMAWFREATECFSKAGTVDAAVDLMMRLLLIWALEDRVADPARVQGVIGREIWRLPEQKAFYEEALVRVGTLLVPEELEGSLPESLQAIASELIKLRIAAGKQSCRDRGK